ncbi:MAG TPA: hypothetical protein VHJ76_00895, partial [Actinomycetota bacterium]|nr:hypothetical protein [Actinomycetota bacterium]
MAETMDRSVLESKAVSELKQIAKSMDLKVTGLKKAEIVDRIAGGSNGAPSSPAPSSSRAPREPKPREKAPAPAPDKPAAAEGSAPEGGGAAPTAVRDEGAVDDRERRS